MLIQTKFRNHNGAEEGILAFSQPSAVSLYDAGATIYGQGDPTGQLYMVEFGTVRLCRVSADGRRQISAFYFAGEVFGFESGDQRHFYAEAVDSAGIRVLRPNQNEQFNRSMLKVALDSLVRAQEHLMVLGRQNSMEKVAAFLLDLAERQKTDRVVDLSMQRADIADYLGLSLETVSRILTRLKCAGTIRIPHVKHIELVDFEELDYLRG
ncbi:MAG: helix-turn-helix domain-containing protein [Candidatus Devosia phytovorans]|uniref:Helix-turn-helix domain-containing protein n=1 Tax=Candidatus Devosia phytovorans TaxID=3121372 RepID=A0AAJ5VZD3_9HYPH|nr:helix-turn-helix domain-containing protein [Devosia sp.]WEK06675.1 MAG: helix-turn-helix domain-containing protein [Devosia sp.]